MPLCDFIYRSEASDVHGEPYTEWTFEIESRIEREGPGEFVQVWIKSIELQKAVVWCDKWGADVQLEKRYAENIACWFQEEIESDSILRETINGRCIEAEYRDRCAR